MNKAKAQISIDNLIDIVRNGGRVRTGLDVYNSRDVLLLEGNVLVDNVNVLLNIKRRGVLEVPIRAAGGGGLWNRRGGSISFGSDSGNAPLPSGKRDADVIRLDKKIKEIKYLKKEAKVKYETAKNNIKTVIANIKKTGGEFNYDDVERTVSDLYSFLTKSDNAFSYLAREIFSYDDYLYNHSINVCTISAAVVNKFNDEFSEHINQGLPQFSNSEFPQPVAEKETSFVYYYPEDVHEMALGFFLHDIGKVMLPDEILNKQGPLSDGEFEIIKTHTFETGVSILEKNNISNIMVKNIVKYHHSRIYHDEPGTYPLDKHHIEIPVYVKICKLADIYDAMTAKRCYKDAMSPVGVITELVRKYSYKDRLLQLILHAFVKTVGIYPPGSIVFLRDGRMAYVVDSDGPIVLPFTDTQGTVLQNKPDYLNLGTITDEQSVMKVDKRRPLKSPRECYDLLPPYLMEAL